MKLGSLAFLAAIIAACSGSQAAEPDLVGAEATPQITAGTSEAANPARTDFEFAGELTQGGFIRGQVPTGTIRATLGNSKLEYADDGSFFAAFDRDAPESITLMATLNNGKFARQEIPIAPRKWNIQHVNVAKGTGRDLEAWWKKREPEYNEIIAARAMETGAEGWKQKFIWPVVGRISGLFGRQRIYRGEPGSYHSGIDIAPGNGVPFVAPADGVVVLARMGFSLEGGLIIIDHGAGLNSAFLHASKIAVEKGQSVKQGQYIGNVGSTGRSSGPHLHWGLKWNDARLDPLLFAGPMP
ncbi:M23 family metallopeptidase [Erythrobacter sp. YT30]|uniref:M23 family metallopeptidase n=1 Tax=Erythrobacter sp. YT30 TaxID=1735012 RepID=UPI00076C6340|nr:M23 family metallopeptidase [Erythrobacter sp. YT30]KWV91463.1 peptidase [Erythrobacter sp. YT30]